MFWINSMAANIFLRFSASMPSSSDSSGFLYYFLYSQVGILFMFSYVKKYESLISNRAFLRRCLQSFCFPGLSIAFQSYCLHNWQIWWLLSDSPQDGPCSVFSRGHVESTIPQVWFIHSHQSIFVIFTHSSSWTAFFTSSEFIYFHSILLIIEVSNVILFLLTIYHLVPINYEYYVLSSSGPGPKSGPG